MGSLNYIRQADVLESTCKTAGFNEATLTKNRWMPITTPQEGFKRVGVVFARLIVEGEDRGVRPFIVNLNDGQNMCPGVMAK